jgi:hypothetical protein
MPIHEVTDTSSTPWVAVAALALLAVGAGWFVRSHAAPEPASHFEHDQQDYLAMARAPSSVDPRSRGHRAWRVLPPMVAGALGTLVGGPERGFLVLTFATFALLPIAAAAWLSAWGASRTSIVTGAAVMALAPPVIGRLAWDVMLVDAPALLLTFIVVTATVRMRIAIACLALFALALTKDTVVVAAAFMLAWGMWVDRRLFRAALAATALIIGSRAALVWWSKPSQASDGLAYLHAVVVTWPVKDLARRLLLVTAGTWNVLLPLVAVAVAGHVWSRRDRALALGFLAAMAQLAVVIGNERIAAAGYPFVLAWSADALDRLDGRRRTLAGVGIVLCQIPWLLFLGRIWLVPPSANQLPHMPVTRYLEIGLFLISSIAAVVAWSRRRTAA